MKKAILLQEGQAFENSLKALLIFIVGVIPLIIQQ